MSPSLSRSASQGRPRPHGRTYTEDEWNRVKQPFHHYYIEKNLSLKESAKHISEIYGFDATLRQWERRIAPEKWSFSKYANRDDRLKQIQDAGKTLLEVSHRGRRKSTASDGRPPINEDRNLRRFARREVSRTRAKSVSGLSDASDQDMTDTSAAPSPAASETFVAESTSNTPFPSFSFGKVDEQWSSPSSQVHNAPIIHVLEHSNDSRAFALPQITFSGPEDPNHIASDSIPTVDQSQVSLHCPPIHNDESFGTYRPQSGDMFDIAFDPIVQNNHPMSTDGGWNNQDSFIVGASKSGNHSAEFDYSDESFTSMMLLGEHDTGVGDTSLGQQLHGFSNDGLQLQESIPTPIAPVDAMPELDNTYSDVHALLQQHCDVTMQMIRNCMRGCINALGRQDFVENHLKLLESGVQAQNNESMRSIRTTLKNISATQRRATRSVYDLSTQRKRKIDELKAEIAALTEPVDEGDSFAYG